MIKFSDAYAHPEWAGVLYDLLRIRTEQDQHANISHQCMPTWDQHVAFMDRKPYYLWFIILTGEPDTAILDRPIGAISVTTRNEIGIMLHPTHRRRGHARQAIEHLIQIYPPLPAIPGERPGTFVANISPSNKTSIKLFTGLGAVHIQNTYQFQEREYGKRNTD